MTLDTPNDRVLLNAIGYYDRAIPGRPLTAVQLAKVAEAVKRLIMDELHSAKAQS